VNQFRNKKENREFQLRIFYKSLKYTSLTQYPKMVDFDLISNIGGILGLFIGCSFASFFEVFEIVIEVIFIIFQKNKKSKVEQNQENAIQSIVKQNNNEECIRRLKFEMQNNFYKINQEITDLRYLKERKTSI